MDEQTKKAFEIFEKYLTMPEEERGAVINTGFFNSFITAYMVLTLKEQGRDLEDIGEAVAILKDLLDTTTAEEAKQQAKGTINF